MGICRKVSNCGSHRREKKVSDVVDILLFLNGFLKNTQQSIEYIDRLYRHISTQRHQGRDLLPDVLPI
ncbi:MAG: hypothetical protein HS132_19310 [Planctomycetia bacterium]|nr:hypothetical protein [Planctomycetia bacterium]